MTMSIQNKLEVKRGNVIQVPGCEPLSAVTSVTLFANNPCNNTIVDLDDALNAIPGSRIEIMFNPKQVYFVLPDGPPPQFGCVTNLCNDWYDVLRNIGKQAEPDNKNICSSDKPTDSFGYFSG